MRSFLIRRAQRSAALLPEAAASWALQSCILILAAGTLFAQHEFSPAEVEEGRRLFLANCVVCHGPEGTAVPGTDIGHDKFKRASSDPEIIQVIRNGIPQTAMPPHTLSEFQARFVVTYLHFLASSAADVTATRGDPGRGKAVFEGKGACLTCHRLRGAGSRLAPDLTDIGGRRRAGDLLRSVVEPDAEILPQNRSVRIVTRDGATVTGRLLNHDAFTVQVLDSNERLVSFSKTNLREFAITDKSPMPSYKDKLSPAELDDLVSYLVSLKGIDKP